MKRSRVVSPFTGQPLGRRLQKPGKPVPAEPAAPVAVAAPAELEAIAARVAELEVRNAMLAGKVAELEKTSAATAGGLSVLEPVAVRVVRLEEDVAGLRAELREVAGAAKLEAVEVTTEPPTAPSAPAPEPPGLDKEPKERAPSDVG